MKNPILFILILILSTGALAQAPQSFSYQAVASDLTGKALANKTVSFRVSILSGSSTGKVEYSETHSGVVTNEFGGVELEIGKGVVTKGTISSIEWGSNTFFSKVEMDPAGGTTYQNLGTCQLLSVPYALYAANAKDTETETFIVNKLITPFIKNGTIIADADGNIYPVVKIGGLVWMAENLKTTRYNDGTGIPNVTDNGAWAALTTGGYCWFNNNQASYRDTYGALYNWFAVNTGKLCPSGWHVPSDAEWTLLEIYLGGAGTAGGNMKETGTSNWLSPNTGATNASGFSGLPGGFRNYSSGQFLNLFTSGEWWTSTAYSAANAWERYLHYNFTSIYRYNTPQKGNGFSVRCVRDAVSILSVFTTKPDSITNNSAFLGGAITSDGGSAVTERGVCYATTMYPTTGNSKVIMGSGTGTFYGKVTGFTANTIYYARAYAINGLGTAYSFEVTFTTTSSGNPSGTFPDSRDGKTYKWVKIGNQVWMAENLAWLPSVSPPASESPTTPYYYVYDYSDTYVPAAKAASDYTTYGVLYNWPAALTACPSGWHLPGDAEWKQLEMALGMTQAQADATGYRGTGLGTKMKNTTGWYSNGNGTDSSGFSGLPGGNVNSLSSFRYIGQIGQWWSSTEDSNTNAWFRSLSFNDTYVNRSYIARGNGYSVRCLRDL